MLRSIVATALLLTAGLSHAGMKVGNVEICMQQRANAELMFDQLQRGATPDQVREIMLKANTQIHGDEAKAKLAVDLPLAFLKFNKLLSKTAAAEFVYLSCDAASRRQHSEALVNYLHENGERCQTAHANDKKAEKNISKCMRKAYEAYEPAAETSPSDKK